MSSEPTSSAHYRAGHVRVVCIGDTHKQHHNLSTPSGGLLICAGEFTYRSGRRSALADFNA